MARDPYLRSTRYLPCARCGHEEADHQYLTPRSAVCRVFRCGCSGFLEPASYPSMDVDPDVEPDVDLPIPNIDDGPEDTLP